MKILKKPDKSIIIIISVILLIIGGIEGFKHREVFDKAEPEED